MGPLHIPGCLIGVFLATSSAAPFGISATASPQEIVRKSVDAIKLDWAQAPKYTYLERDVESKRHSPATTQTYRVLMISGTPYNILTAVNDRSLSREDQAAEQRKLQDEIEKRKNESLRERERRLAKYEKGLTRNHQMLQEMVGAFQFHLMGTAEVNGHQCWVLDTQPRADYQPNDREGRVLKGMKGRLWIDQATSQWVKVHAEVVTPVSFFGFLAKVGPGTQFDLVQEPVADGIWLARQFNVSVKASALGFLNENSIDNESFRDYELMPSASAFLKSKK